MPINELEQWLESDQPLPASTQKELIIKNADNEKVFVPMDTIQWIDAAGDYMCVHTQNENYIVRITMKKLSSQLDPQMFQRIHKSTVVNINCIERIQSLRNNQSIVDLGNNVRLKVSRNYHAAIQNIIKVRQLDL